ncbi:hypothetical protein SPHV1_760007 [Novosphingobium sp. KN65.2]|nr:hypothetical protein SPHV1_760007 [Novosphingobium sp. KN65.2]
MKLEYARTGAGTTTLPFRLTRYARPEPERILALT